MSLENKIEMINDKFRMKAIQSRLYNDKTWQRVDIRKMKEKYSKQVNVPTFVSTYNHQNNSIESSSPMIQSLIQKYNPNEIRKKEHINNNNNFSRHNNRYSYDSYTQVKGADIHYPRSIPLYSKDKQASFYYSMKPKEQTTNMKESIPILDFTSITKNSDNNQYEVERLRNSERTSKKKYFNPYSSRMSFGVNNSRNSSEKFDKISLIKNRIDWLKREKRNIKSKIDSYSKSPEKEEKKEISIDRKQVDSYLKEFFNKNDQNNLCNIYKINPLRVPILLQRSVLKLKFPNFSSIN